MESILEPATINKAGVELQIIPTADHSDTIFSQIYNETYHSKHGAIQETRHVFIKYGLLPLLEHKSEIAIFEMGLGTALNVMETIEQSTKTKAVIHYHGIEKHPIESSVVEKLNYTQYWEDETTKRLFKKIHELPWNTACELYSSFFLTKLHQDIFELNSLLGHYDLIYQDAFAPSCQPEMWGETIINKFHSMLKQGGVLVTYCAQGQFKRNLKAAGFLVESLPGPIGKREMTRATKI